MKSITLFLVNLILAGILLSGCGASKTKISTVNVRAGEMYFKVDRQSAPAGKVKFTVTNEGKTLHEMVLLKTDLAPDKIPAESGDANEASENDSVGEIPDLAAGQTKSKVFTLTKGHYVLICNIPGHYKAGMYSEINIK